MTPEFLDSYAGRMERELGRPVTPLEAEEEVVRICYRVAGSLATAYRYGYHSAADVRQTGVLLALEVIAKGKYDITRPLDNFLYVHLRNQLFNDKRKHFMRSEAPCKCCDAFNPGENPCPKWRAWDARNAAKKSLMKAVPADAESSADRGGDAADEAATRELMARIDRELPVDLRGDYLRMRSGHRVPKGRRQRLRQALSEILNPERH